MALNSLGIASRGLLKAKTSLRVAVLGLLVQFAPALEIEIPRGGSGGGISPGKREEIFKRRESLDFLPIPPLSIEPKATTERKSNIEKATEFVALMRKTGQIDESEEEEAIIIVLALMDDL